MATVCPDNSTECLLRALLEAQNEFNWDPATFAVTVVIGALALLVAMATVFQGLLGAGPGRMKTSAAAIGPYWSKTAKTRFDWKEFRFRTSVEVPYIELLEQFEGLPNNAVGEKIITYPARWSTLLENIGLQPHENHTLATVVVEADHLPSDIIAAPAWTSVRVAVHLAVMAGCDTIESPKDSEYPIVRGDTCQLRFREHPDLGTVAVFDQLKRSRAYVPVDHSTDSTIMSRIIEENSDKLDYPKCRDSFTLFRRLARKEQTLDMCRKALYGFIPCSLRALLLSADNWIVSLLKISKHVPILKSTDTNAYCLFISNCMISLTSPTILTGGFKHSAYSTNFPSGRDPNSLSMPLKRPWSWRESEYATDAFQIPEWTALPVVDDFTCSICSEIIKACYEEDTGQVANKVKSYIRSYVPVRGCFQSQLVNLDKWISAFGDELADCEVEALLLELLPEQESNSNLAATDPRLLNSLAKLPSADATHSVDHVAELKSKPEPGIGEAVSPSPSHSDKHQSNTSDTVLGPLERREKMRSILFFRAVLYTAYICTATDISEIWGSDVGQRVVQML